MNMKKKIYQSLLLICAIFFLSGCQGKDDEAALKAKQPEVRGAFVQKKKKETKKKKKTETETKKETEKETEIETEISTETESEIETESESEDETEFSGAIVASDDTFDYVALGNSVTCNEIDPELWWSNWGMAATSEDKDYVHLVSAWLGGQTSQSVATTVLSVKEWEVAQQRDEALKGYEQYFNEHTDLVTLQIGENIVEFKETMESDFTNFVGMIREKAPNAQILMLGEMLWPSEDIEAAKHIACEAHGVPFIEMTEFFEGYRSNVYRSALGTEVAGADGGTYAISNEVVAAHPNDEGMACIAQLIINNISIH